MVDLPRSGRPRSITRAQDRLLVTTTLRNRQANAMQLQGRLYWATGVQVSTQTVKNRLHDQKIRARRQFVVPQLTARH